MCFALCTVFLIPLLPSELRDVEAYAHKNNEKSHGILRRLGLVVVGENKRGDSYHFRGGQYADLLRWHFQDSGEEGGPSVKCKFGEFLSS